MDKLIRVTHNDKLIALILKNKYQSEGIEFFTDTNEPLQFGYMRRGKGYYVKPHFHNEIERKILVTQEVIFIKSGTVKINLFNDQNEPIRNLILEQGDFVMLNAGGHSFEFISESEIIEIKNGPHFGNLDKTQF